MKKLSTLGIIATLLFLCLPTSRVEAQSWTNVAPAGEQFTVQLPGSPKITPQKYSVGQFNVEGQVYSVLHNGVQFNLWSFKNPRFADYESMEGETYADGCADLVWDGLFKPWRDKLPKAEEPLLARMSWAPNLKSIKVPGADYLVRIGETQGLVHIINNAEQLYVLATINTAADSDETQQFINSFSLSPQPSKLPDEAAPSPSTGIKTESAGTVATGEGGRLEPSGVTDNRVLRGNEVDERARLLSKPEPLYTEHARKYWVKGTVVLRVAFSRTGQVTNIIVVRSLPHGLMLRAIKAAKNIKFVPATKDGQPVSTFIQLEYNFNLY